MNSFIIVKSIKKFFVGRVVLFNPAKPWFVSFAGFKKRNPAYGWLPDCSSTVRAGQTIWAIIEHS
jgi:hypothetical protein